MFLFAIFVYKNPNIKQSKLEMLRKFNYLSINILYVTNYLVSYIHIATHLLNNQWKMLKL